MASADSPTRLRGDDDDVGEVDFGMLQRINDADIDTLEMDLAQTKLIAVPIDLFRLQNIQELYMEGNRLTALPGDLFRFLTSLEYLDVRFNKIRSLPTVIGEHDRLRTILLQGNQISALPIEMGLMPSLTTISLADNPLYFPDEEVVSGGTQAIMRFLRSRLAAGKVLKESAFVTAPSVVSGESSANQSAGPSTTVTATSSLTTIIPQHYDKLSPIKESPTRPTDNDLFPVTTTKITATKPARKSKHAPTHTTAATSVMDHAHTQADTSTATRVSPPPTATPSQPRPPHSPLPKDLAQHYIVPDRKSASVSGSQRDVTHALIDAHIKANQSGSS